MMLWYELVLETACICQTLLGSGARMSTIHFIEYPVGVGKSTYAKATLEKGAFDGHSTVDR